MRRLLMGVAALALASGAAVAEQSDFSSGGLGTATGQFLTLGAGARAAALGDAVTAAVDDASALYWNPAALTVPRRSLVLMRASYIEDTTLDYAAFSQRMGPAAFGLSLQQFSAGSLTAADSIGNETGSFTPKDRAYTAGLAFVVEGMSFGASFKSIESDIQKKARGTTVDAGFLGPQLLGGRLRVGAAATNLTGTLKFDVEEEKLPKTYRLGVAARPIPDVTVTADAVSPVDDKIYVAVGGEYRLGPKGGPTLALRGGFNTRAERELGGMTGVSFGAGFAFPFMSVDYALSSLGNLGTIHRVSVSFPLGSQPAAPERRRARIPRSRGSSR